MTVWTQTVDAGEYSRLLLYAHLRHPEAEDPPWLAGLPHIRHHAGVPPSAVGGPGVVRRKAGAGLPVVVYLVRGPGLWAEPLVVQLGMVAGSSL